MSRGCGLGSWPTIVKRGKGRPPKTALPVIPPTLKARGGKRKAAAALA
jgi:hypothetical protein